MNSLREQFDQLAERGPHADPRFVVRTAVQDASRRHEDFAAADVYRIASSPPTRQRPTRLVAAAVAIVLLVGVVGLVALRDRDAGAPRASTPVVTISPPSADPSPAALLDTPVPADTRPLIAFERSGWHVDNYAGFQPVSSGAASAQCPGCAAERLVVVADGSLWSGALFTAWVVTGAPELVAELDTRVTISTGLEGGASESPPGTPAARAWTTLAWPLGDGPGAAVAVVDARGLPSDEVFDMARALTFEEHVDLPAVPAGFRVVARPGELQAAPEWTYVGFTNGPDQLQVFATNRGVQGLLDWRFLVMGDVIGGDWAPRTIGETTVGYSWSDEDGLAWGSAFWVSGDWAYMVDGPQFADVEFADAVADLVLADQAAFDRAVAGASVGGYEFDLSGGDGWASKPRYHQTEEP